MIDQIFESSFPKDEAPAPPPPPPAPEPKTQAPVGTAGQSLIAPSVPALPDLNLPKLPKPAVVATEGSNGQTAAGEAGQDSKGEDSESADADQPQEPRAERSTAEDRAAARSGAYRVSSTAYCLTGTMASGRLAYSGAVAMNGTSLGSRYQVLDGPRAGETFVVEDRIGRGSSFDIAYPGDCRGAYSYGRRTISIRPV